MSAETDRERWQRVKQLLDEAIGLNAGDRSPFLERACDGDSALRLEVESLLSSHEQAGTGFLRNPAVDVNATAKASEPRAGRRIGVYQIVEEIGRGGMGDVYRAVRDDGQYTKEVAIKLVRSGGDSRSLLERFRNERQILASLDHPNIARLLDGGTDDDGAPYLVMELIEGTRIDAYCDEHRLTITERLRLFAQVCGAVQFAHQRLVIHRDIKPGNVLVTKEGTPKLLDFGIAKLLDPTTSGQTTMTQAMTPDYASPEQIRGEPITTASDVYSLGVVLYQLLTGRSPYPEDTRSPHQLARAICDTEPGRPSTVVTKPQTRAGDAKIATDTEEASRTREGSPAKLQRRLAGDLDAILLMALRKEPTRRYGSVEQFAEDLRRHLEGRPVRARKGSWTYQAEKFVRRHKVGMAAAAVVLLAIAGGVGATVREARIAQANARRAENRFNDVRHLANSLIFDVDKSIADVPGTTAARKLLVNNALQYLDTLASEAKGDVTLQRELAGAYFKLGGIQGNPYNPNLGETSAALASYHKALTIREAIAAANPTNKDDQIALAYTHELLGAIALITSGNPQEALADESKALTILEPLAKEDPKNIGLLDKLRGAYATIGHIEGGNGASANLADMDAALENHRKALAITELILHDKPDDEAARSSLAVSDMSIAEILVKKGDRTGALLYYQKATDILEALYSSASTAYALNLQTTYQRIGNVHMMDGNSASALENYRKEMEIMQRAVKQDPKNATARVSAAYGTVFLGLATAESGNVKQGLATMQTGIDLLEKEVKQNPGESILRRYSGVTLLLRGQVLFKSGNSDGALSDFKRTAAIQEGLVSANASDTDAQVALAAANAKIADVLAMRGENTSAIGVYQKSLSVVEPLAHSAHPLLQAQYAAADAYRGLGAVLQKQASENGIPVAQQRESLKQACSWFQQSLAEWQRVPNPGKYSPTGFESASPSRVTQQLSSCEAQLKKQTDRTQVAHHLNQ